METEQIQNANQKTDIELVDETKQGNRKSFSELVKRHQKNLLRLSLRFVKSLDLAEDIVQDSFIKAYEKLHSFEGRASFKSWLFQIAVNTARNKLRETKRDTTDIDKVQVAVLAVAESHLVHSAIAAMIQEEVEKLPFKQKTALVLRVYEDLSFKEIAEVMECPYDTAKANYRHALLKLKEVFESKNDFKEISFESQGFWLEMNQFVEAEG
ncbi:MAG: RNA polymerase sigma factor [Pseudobdellovibrionaceae bacterium]